MLQPGEAIGDVVINEWDMADSYEAAIDTIEWGKHTDSYTVLDRKTLSISFNRMDYSGQWSVWQEWACELAESMDA